MGKSARSARASSCLRSVLTATIAWYVARSSLRVPGSPSRLGGGNGADAGPEARIPAGQAGPGSRLRYGRRPNNNRIILLSPAKNIVWQKDGLHDPDDAFFTPEYGSIS